jgi:two-component system response regulator HydG
MKDAKSHGKLLVLDDEKDTCELLELTLVQDGFEVVGLTSASEALKRLADEDFNVLLTDIGMEEMSGIEVCERALEARPDLPIIVVTAQGSFEMAVAAMRAGAYDFITKPVDTKILSMRVARAANHSELEAEVKRLRAAVASAPDTMSALGESSAMRRVAELVARVGSSDASVLIHGETGTGKELVARAIHAASARKSGPFVALNCAAVPPALIESELFGHARGAFTDAKAQRTGLFVEAAGGTLFLDEVGELPIEMQPKLLRALQERKVRPVGSNAEVPFDARIVTATNRDLEYEVFHKRFREDLFYRINVVKIDVPPLRERGGDILTLTARFLNQFALRSGKPNFTIAPQAAEKLMSYDWPGNVRELENCIERAVALARFDQLTVDDLPEKIRKHRANRVVMSAEDLSDVVSLEELERRYILRVVNLVGGNKTQAAQLLGLDRRTLYRRLERYEAEAAAPLPEAPAVASANSS